MLAALGKALESQANQGAQQSPVKVVAETPTASAEDKKEETPETEEKKDGDAVEGEEPTAPAKKKRKKNKKRKKKGNGAIAIDSGEQMSLGASAFVPSGAAPTLPA